MTKIITAMVVSAVLILGGQTLPAAADDAAYQAALKDIGQTMGFVPTFLRQVPKAALPGAWTQLKGIHFSQGTALSPKVKALIALGVNAQTPCDYCIWAATGSARAAGASDEEIGEAIAVAATERYWSTILNGLQADLPTFKAEFGRLFAAAPAK